MKSNGWGSRVTKHRRLLAVALAGLFLLLPTPVFGQGSSGEKDIQDLRTEADVRIVLLPEGDPRELKVAPGGDFNGDGIPDALLSWGSNEENDRGTTYVIFGRRPMPPRIELGPMSVEDGAGFTIEGTNASDRAWKSAPAGDVNGDGLEDVVVGAGGAQNQAGRGYVVFGKTDSAPVSLALFDMGAQGPLGFRIDGPPGAFLGGDGVAGVGDMNGDGLDDVVLAASFVGRSYIVFGKKDDAPVDLASLEQAGAPPDIGIRIKTPATGISEDYEVGAAGDVNGDGIPDVIIGIIGKRRHNRVVRQSCGCVVFGRRDAGTINVRRLDGKGFKIKGRGIYWSVSGAGDVNGDGLDDLVVGAPYSNHCCGKAFVVFGKRSSWAVWVADLAGKGFRIGGSESGSHLGSSVSSAGDVDGDGLADVFVGAPGANSPGEHDAKGAAYLLYGKRRSGTIRTGSLGERGYAMNGGAARDVAGTAVAGLGDMDGDGVPDLIIGSGAGEAYLVWGRR